MDVRIDVKRIHQQQTVALLTVPPITISTRDSYYYRYCYYSVMHLEVKTRHSRRKGGEAISYLVYCILHAVPDPTFCSLSLNNVAAITPVAILHGTCSLTLGEILFDIGMIQRYEYGHRVCYSGERYYYGESHVLENTPTKIFLQNHDAPNVSSPPARTADRHLWSFSTERNHAQV